MHAILLQAVDDYLARTAQQAIVRKTAKEQAAKWSELWSGSSELRLPDAAEDVLDRRARLRRQPIVVRDAGLLESAVHRPRPPCSAGGLPGPVEKAAALLQSLAINHPFVDGNKRTAWLAWVTFLAVNGVDLRPGLRRGGTAGHRRGHGRDGRAQGDRPGGCGTWSSTRCDARSHRPAARPVRTRVAHRAAGRVARLSYASRVRRRARSGSDPRTRAPRTGDRDYYRRLLAPPLTRLSRPRPLGYRQQAACLAAGGDGEVHPGAAAGLPRGRHARRRQDDLRADARVLAAAPPRRAADDRRRADRAPEEAVGGGGRPDRDQARPGVQRGTARARSTTASPSRTRVSACGPCCTATAASSARPSSSSTRSTTPVTRKSWGEACLEAFEPGHPAARADRYAVPVRHQPDPVRRRTRRGTTGSGGPPPTTPTATATRSPTASSGPSSSSPTAATCAGAPRPATRSPPGSASR